MAGMSDKDIRVGAFTVHRSKESLGKGSFGAVFKGTYVKKNSPVAVKQIKYLTEESLGKTFMMDMAKKEIKSLMTLNGHPNIVEYYDHWDDGSSFWLIMEYCQLGDLEHYILNHKKNPDLHTKIQLMLQCARGIAFMHSFEPPFVHRDVKLKNFLVTRNSLGEDVVKVTDFGVAKFLEESIGQTSVGEGIMKTLAGTPPFMAPEFWETDKEIAYTSSIDIFSLGLVFQALLLYPKSLTKDNGILPIVGRSQIIHVIFTIFSPNLFLYLTNTCEEISSHP